MNKREILEQRIIIREERLKRIKSDPLLTFEYTPKQREFRDIFFSKKHKFCCLFCANRSGKTQVVSAIASELLRFGWPDDPGKPVNIWFASKNFDQSEEIVQPKMFYQ